jgi:hypothetical protein
MLPPAIAIRAITPITITPAAQETQEFKAKKNLPLSTLNDRK